MRAVEYLKITHLYPTSVCHVIMQVRSAGYKCVAAATAAAAAAELNECFFPLCFLSQFIQRASDLSSLEDRIRPVAQILLSNTQRVCNKTKG